MRLPLWLIAFVFTLPAACSTGPTVADSGIDAAIGSDAMDVSNADSPEVSYLTLVNIVQLTEACTPPPPADPLRFQGTLLVQNTGAQPIGPITIGEGHIVGPSGDVATFALQDAPVSIGILPPGMTGSAPLDELNGSLSPSNLCDLLACDMSTVRLRFDISGNNIEPGATITSGFRGVGCQ